MGSIVNGLFALIFYVGQLLLTALYMGLFLYLSVQWALKIKISYAKAYMAALVGVFLFDLPSVVRAIPYYTALLWGERSDFQALEPQSLIAALALSVATTGSGFLFCSWAFGRLIKHPKTELSIGFWDGMKVAVCQLFLTFLLTMLLMKIRHMPMF